MMSPLDWLGKVVRYGDLVTAEHLLNVLAAIFVRSLKIQKALV